MKYIVTGGAGFIGSHLVDRLVEKTVDAEIVVIDNLYRATGQYLQPHLDAGAVTFIPGDVRDAKLLERAFVGGAVVFHLAAQSNVIGSAQNVDYAFETNVAGTLNVLKAARSRQVRRVVFTSSREVYGEAQTTPVAEDHPLNSKNSYGASKLSGEAYCRVFQNNGDVETAVVRLANVYGPRDTGRVIPIWLERAARSENLIVYGGEQLIDFVWIDQVVDALLEMGWRDGVCGLPINIGSGQGIPILTVAERILSLIETTSKIDIVPARSLEVVKFEADVTRMRTLLGIQPAVDPLAYLSDMITSRPRVVH